MAASQPVRKPASPASSTSAGDGAEYDHVGGVEGGRGDGQGAAGTAPFFPLESSFNDGTAQTARDPPFRGAGSHHLKKLVYGGLGLTLSEKALAGSEWLLAILVGLGAIKGSKELIIV